MFLYLCDMRTFDGDNRIAGKSAIKADGMTNGTQQLSASARIAYASRTSARVLAMQHLGVVCMTMKES
jgi:hypothetical protein